MHTDINLNVDPASTSFIADCVRRCKEVLGTNLAAMWAAGSLATGDYSRDTSDIDLFGTLNASIPRREFEALAAALRTDVAPCPAHGVELVLYLHSDLVVLSRNGPFLFSFAHGDGWPTSLEFGGDYPGGLIDLAIAHEQGVSLDGPHPRAFMQSVPIPWLREEIAASLRWHLTKLYDPFHDPLATNAVLNAARALAYARLGRFVSKKAGARWLLDRAGPPIIELALRHHGRRDGVPLEPAPVQSFLSDVLAELEDA